MTLNRDSQETIAARANADPAFTKALLDEAATLYLEGDVDTAKTVLHTVIRVTIGYEHLAEQITKPRRSLQRMLSRSGRLTMRNLAAIFQTLKDARHVNQLTKSIRLA